MTIVAMCASDLEAVRLGTAAPARTDHEEVATARFGREEPVAATAEIEDGVLGVVLDLEGRLLRVVHHPEKDGVDVHGHRVGRQGLLGSEAGRDRALIDPRADRVDKRNDPEESRALQAD